MAQMTRFARDANRKLAPAHMANALSKASLAASTMIGGAFAALLTMAGAETGAAFLAFAVSGTVSLYLTAIWEPR